MPGRGIGLFQGIALYTGAVLGTGVLALPALAARQAGPASLVAWAGLVVLSIPVAATFAALAGRHPDSGGLATFAARAFGPRVAAITGWWFFFSIPVGMPLLGLFGGSYVTAAVGGGRTDAVLIGALLIGIAVAANWMGVRVSARLQLGLASCLAALLAVAIATSIPHAHLANLRPFAPRGWLAVGSAATLLVWSFAGWETVTHLAADFAHPARDLPRATAAALVLIGVLYLGVAASSVLVVGPSLGRVDAPLAVLLTRGLGGSVRGLAAVVAVVVSLGTINAYLAAGSKLGAALGRDGALPPWLARGSEAGGIPRRSLGVIVGMLALVIIVQLTARLDVNLMVRATTSCLITIYAVGCAAGVRLLPRGGSGRRVATVALALVGSLLLLAGPFLAWPLFLASAALLARRRIERRSRVPVGGPQERGASAV